MQTNSKIDKSLQINLDEVDNPKINEENFKGVPGYNVDMGNLNKNKKVLTPSTDKELIEDGLYPADSAQLKGRREAATDSPTEADEEPSTSEPAEAEPKVTEKKSKKAPKKEEPAKEETEEPAPKKEEAPKKAEPKAEKEGDDISEDMTNI